MIVACPMLVGLTVAFLGASPMPATRDGGFERPQGLPLGVNLWLEIDSDLGGLPMGVHVEDERGYVLSMDCIGRPLLRLGKDTCGFDLFDDHDPSAAVNPALMGFCHKTRWSSEFPPWRRPGRCAPPAVESIEHRGTEMISTCTYPDAETDEIPFDVAIFDHGQLVTFAAPISAWRERSWDTRLLRYPRELSDDGFTPAAVASAPPGWWSIDIRRDRDTLRIETRWKGELDGSTVEFTRDGRVIAVESWLAGERYGLWIVFDAHSVPVWFGNYFLDVLVVERLWPTVTRFRPETP